MKLVKTTIGRDSKTFVLKRNDGKYIATSTTINNAKTCQVVGETVENALDRLLDAIAFKYSPNDTDWVIYNFYADGDF